jgi:hypothetical protein
MSDQFYVLEGSGQRVGPFTVQQLVDLAGEGRISRKTELIKVTDNSTTLASEVEGLVWPSKTVSRTTQNDLGKRNNRFLIFGVGLAVGAVAVPLIGVAMLPDVVGGRTHKAQDAAFGLYSSAYYSMGLYLADSNDVFPPEMSSPEVIRPYLQAHQGDSGFVVVQHENGIKVKSNPKLAKASLRAIESPERTLLYFDASDWKNTQRLVVGVDGNTFRVSGKTVEKACSSHYLLPKGAGQ